MRIILLVDSLDFGGSERSVQILANNLIDRLENLMIISLSDMWKYPLDKRIARTSIYEENYSFSKKFIFLPKTISLLKKKLQEYNPDIVISFTPQSNLLNAFITSRSSWKRITSERHYAEDYYGEKNILARPLIRWMHNRVDAVIANDLAIKNSLIQYYSVRSPIFVLNNLFDPANIPPIQRQAPEKSNFKFVTVGRLSKEKNTADSIKAFANVQDKKAILEIIGNGPLMEELKGLTAELGVKDRVRFLGHQSNPFQYMINADAFVFSSLNEGFPNVILEAMYCRLPVISYHFRSGISTILEEGKNGLLIELGNKEKLAEAMNQVIEDSTLRKHLSEQSEKTIKRFSDKLKYIDDFEKIVNEVL